ncbi:hypothetical protein GCM10011348_46280 [Marinobacterium nitratireducens]|uniref:Uncharacterized protein n=1 Tax=Marinobacterium nitratireducens TaxID=518897 RepID=A0A918DYM2_9GAMM|nr:hypothetical protein [Marinobacterium nitratireducens]GGO89166.1 hypothetical protein GCM10011348_46280 [Marinobacterium nitratireducens]
MNNADMPAMPMDVDHIEYAEQCRPIRGFTKREAIAMHLHATLLSATDADGAWSGVDAGAAECAVREADALLAELEKPA